MNKKLAVLAETLAENNREDVKSARTQLRSAIAFVVDSRAHLGEQASKNITSLYDKILTIAGTLEEKLSNISGR